MKEMNPEKSFVRGDYERLKTAVIRNISNDIKKVSNVKKFYLRDLGHFGVTILRSAIFIRPCRSRISSI